MIIKTSYGSPVLGQKLIASVRPGAAAVIRIGSRALKNEVMWTLAAAAFIAIFFLHVPFPLIIISAALILRTVYPF
jgi:chromate transporter